MRRFQPYIAINLYYEGADTSFDKKLAKIAFDLGGEDGGSGYGGGYRDLSFCFDDLKSAHQFFTRARRFKKMKLIGSRIGSGAMLHEEDF